MSIVSKSKEFAAHQAAKNEAAGQNPGGELGRSTNRLIGFMIRGSKLVLGASVVAVAAYGIDALNDTYRQEGAAGVASDGLDVLSNAAQKPIGAVASRIDNPFTADTQVAVLDTAETETPPVAEANEISLPLIGELVYCESATEPTQLPEGLYAYNMIDNLNPSLAGSEPLVMDAVGIFATINQVDANNPGYEVAYTWLENCYPIQ